MVVKQIEVIPEKISCRALVTSSSLHCLGAQIPQRMGESWKAKKNNPKIKSILKRKSLTFTVLPNLRTAEVSYLLRESKDTQWHQGLCTEFSSGGAKEECMKEIFFGEGGGGGRTCLWISIQFLWSDGQCYYNNKAIDFFPHLQWCCYRAWKFTITKLKIQIQIQFNLFPLDVVP